VVATDRTARARMRGAMGVTNRAVVLDAEGNRIALHSTTDA